jgi:peroxiredoxin
MQQHSIQKPSRSLARYVRTAAIAAVTFALAMHAGAAPDLVGAPAPDFALRSLARSNVRLSEHLGQVVLLNFWATWCGPCRQEMPQLDALYTKYQRAGFVIFGINIDEDADHAAEMARTLGVRYPLLFDSRKDVSRAYRLDSMPLTVLIDREGVVRYVSEGYRPGYEKRYAEQLRELLGE